MSATRIVDCRQQILVLGFPFRAFRNYSRLAEQINNFSHSSDQMASSDTDSETDRRAYNLYPSLAYEGDEDIDDEAAAYLSSVR